MKRVLSLFISVVLIFSCLTVPAFSENQEPVVTADELELMHALGIISAPSMSDEQLNTVVTRAEAAEYFCSMLNLKIADSTEFEGIFYDVTSETPNAKYIKTIYSAGYMQGDGNGRFRPNASISTMEAARVMTGIIGYKGFIAVKGLDSVIKKTDVLNGVPIADTVKLGEFLKMIYNILHAPACRITGYGDSGTEFVIDNNYLGAEHLFGVVYAKGVVNGIPGTTLTQGIESIKENRIAVNNFVHAYDKDGSKFLGYNVDYYYKNNAEFFDIVYIKYSDRNNTLVLNYDELESYSAFTYRYQRNNKTKSVSITPQTDVIYNGVACSTLTNAEMIPGYGKVTLLDNNDDNAYDVVLIDSYEFMVVDTINRTKKIIKDKLNGISVDYSTADEVVVTNEGEPYDIERVYTGNLLAVRRSKTDEGYYKIFIDVNKNEITGAEIKSVGRDTVTANGTKYTVWSRIDATSRANLKVGQTVTIYIIDNMIIGATKVDGVQSYAYLLGVSKPETFSDKVSFKMILPDLSEVIREGNTKIKIDGVVCSTAAAINTALSTGAAQSVSQNPGAPLAQPIKYTINSQGKLLSIDTLYFNPAAEDATTSLRRPAGTSYRYRSYNGGLYQSVNTFVASGTTYMGIPIDDRSKIEDYKKSAPSSESRDYRMDICTIDPENNLAEFVFYYMNADTTADDYTMFIVLDKIQQVNGEGDVENVLHLGYSGKEYDYPVLSSITNKYNDLLVGDIINFDVNGKGYIREIKREGRLSTLISNPPGKEDRVGPQLSTSGKNNTTLPPYDGARILYAGTAIDISMGKMLYTPSLVTDIDFDPDYRKDILVVSSAVVYKYSVKRGAPSIEVGTLDDIVTYKVEPARPTPIVVYISSNQVKYIFVVEN